MARVCACAHIDPASSPSERLEAVASARAVVPGPRRIVPTSARLKPARELTPVTRVSPAWTIRELSTSRDVPPAERTTTAPETFVTTGTVDGGGASAAMLKPGHVVRKRQSHARYRIDLAERPLNRGRTVRFFVGTRTGTIGTMSQKLSS